MKLSEFIWRLGNTDCEVWVAEFGECKAAIFEHDPTRDRKRYEWYLWVQKDIIPHGEADSFDEADKAAEEAAEKWLKKQENDL